MRSTPRSSLCVEGLARSVPAGRSEVGVPRLSWGSPPPQGGAGEVSSSPRYRAKGRETGWWELLGCRALPAESSPVFSPLAGCDKQVHFFVSSFPSVTFRVTQRKSCVGNSACCSAGCQLAPFRRGCPFFCRDGRRQMERFRSGLQVQVCHFDFSWKEIFQNGSLSHSKKFCFMNFPSEWIFRGDRLDGRSHQ
ncbi:uncharacterized protein LOC128145602 isoform X4 [Harpia harpyja]|uniref:uncharacterized protein LOC128145602 isoform X4 n=1 Tax=Harpia harpyja TaxID=202280 RepID=UPI0022B0B1C6|nr:uncharacterized protein LOC128145602 isoform X4 [Harpia harpyja]